MKHFMIAAIVALPLALPGCSSTTKDISAGAAVAQGPLKTACDALIRITNIAGLVPGVGAIEPYVSAGCNTAEGFAKLLSDPTSLEWVGQLEGKVQALASVAGIKI